MAEDPVRAVVRDAQFCGAHALLFKLNAREWQVATLAGAFERRWFECLAYNSRCPSCLASTKDTFWRPSPYDHELCLNAPGNGGNISNKCRQLCDSDHRHSLRDNETIFKQGDEGHHFYLLEAGSVLDGKGRGRSWFPY